MKKNLFILATFFLSAISREARAEVLQGFNSITYTNSSATNGEYTNPNGILKMVCCSRDAQTDR